MGSIYMDSCVPNQAMLQELFFFFFVWMWLIEEKKREKTENKLDVVCIVSKLAKLLGNVRYFWTVTS